MLSYPPEMKPHLPCLLCLFMWDFSCWAPLLCGGKALICFLFGLRVLSLSLVRYIVFSESLLDQRLNFLLYDVAIISATDFASMVSTVSVEVCPHMDSILSWHRRYCQAIVLHFLNTTKISLVRGEDFKYISSWASPHVFPLKISNKPLKSTWGISINFLG